jgi:hypothetical protein
MLRLLALAALLLPVGPATAADINLCRQADICISGIINEDDVKHFAWLTTNYPAGTIVWLDGPGGKADPMLDIGDIIHQRGFSTATSWANRYGPDGYCASACALLFLTGRHAIIGRNSLLVFHQGSINGQPIDDELNAIMADRIIKWGGLTRDQIWTLLHAAPPSGGRPGTEAWALALGIRFCYVPVAVGMWRSCGCKFCVAI